jgi:soluble lytic murein transglycosylase
MPVVPSLDPSQQVTPSQAPDFQGSTAVTASLLDQGSQQFSQAGDALGQAANAQSQMVIDAQNLANQTRVNDAVNQLKTTQQDLMYNPQTGVQAQTGVNAIQRSSGMSLADEYTGKLTDTASQISSRTVEPDAAAHVPAAGERHRGAVPRSNDAVGRPAVQSVCTVDAARHGQARIESGRAQLQ